MRKYQLVFAVFLLTGGIYSSFACAFQVSYRHHNGFRVRLLFSTNAQETQCLSSMCSSHELFFVTINGGAALVYILPIPANEEQWRAMSGRRICEDRLSFSEIFNEASSYALEAEYQSYVEPMRQAALQTVEQAGPSEQAPVPMQMLQELGRNQLQLQATVQALEQKCEQMQAQLQELSVRGGQTRRETFEREHPQHSTGDSFVFGREESAAGLRQPACQQAPSHWPETDCWVPVRHPRRSSRHDLGLGVWVNHKSQRNKTWTPPKKTMFCDQLLASGKCKRHSCHLEHGKKGNDLEKIKKEHAEKKTRIICTSEEENHNEQACPHLHIKLFTSDK